MDFTPINNGIEREGVLSYALEDAIKRMASELEMSAYSRDAQKREVLEAKLERAEKKLKEKQGAIRSEQKLLQTLDEVDRYKALIARINSGQFNLADFDLLESSDLELFFDNEFSISLSELKAMMQARVSSASTFLKNDPELARIAESDWEKHAQELAEETQELGRRKQRLEQASLLDLSDEELETFFGKQGSKEIKGAITLLDGLDNRTKDWIKKSKALEKQLEYTKRKEIRRIADDIKDQRKEIEKGKKEWIKKQATAIQSQQLVKLESFSGSFDSSAINRLQEMMKEFKNIELERAYNYLEKQIDALTQELEASALGSPTRERIGAQFYKAKSLIRSRSMDDPDQLRNLAEGIKEGKKALSESIAELSHIEANRDQLVQEVKSGHQKLSAEIQKITPSLVKRVEKALMNQGVTDPLILGQLKTLEELAKPHGEARKALAQIEARLPGLHMVSAEELEGYVNDVRAFSKQVPLNDIEGFLNLLEGGHLKFAKAAHLSIQGLEKANSGKKIENVLKKNLGLEYLSSPHRYGQAVNGDKDKHVKVLPSSEFAQYQKHTTGNMVYMERMTGAGTKEWYIFVDERALKSSDKEATERLKRQLTHELLHVEFEHGGLTTDEEGNTTTMKQRAIQEFTQYGKWTEIEAVFRKMVSETGEVDSHGSMEWPLEDIVSELFAMQRELGIVEIKEGKGRGQNGSLSALDRLNNLVYEFNEGKSHVSERILGFKDAYYDETKHGYVSDAYVEAGEEFNRSGDGFEGVSLENAARGENQQKIDFLQDIIDTLKANPTLGKIKDGKELIGLMDDYHQRTRRLNDRNDAGLDEDIKKRIKQIAGDVDTVQNEIHEFEQQEPNREMGFLRKMWNNTTFLSIKDFVQAGKQAMDYINRRLERRTEDHAAKINKAIFGKTGIGLEAAAKEQAAEQKEVSQWEENYKLLDPIQLEALLEGVANSVAPDRDQVKAILRVLASKGRINWQDPNLWKALNKLQSATYLRPGDEVLLSDPNKLRARLNKAISTIYDRDEFPSLEQKNTSTLESQKNEKAATHDKTPTQMTAKLDRMLQRHMSGIEAANPIDYESMIEYCVKSGKSYAENVMFHLVSGMARGILAPDRGLNMVKHCSAWPPIQLFENYQYSQEGFRKLCETRFKKEYEDGRLNTEGKSEFMNWFFTEAINAANIQDRVEKSVKNKAWDPDWGRTVVCIGDAEVIKQFMGGKGGAVDVQLPAIEGAYVGILQYLEENSLNPAASREIFAKSIGNITMLEGILGKAAYNTPGNMYARQVNNNAVPNEGSVGGYPDATLGQIRRKLEGFVDGIDPELFALLREKPMITDRDREQQATRIKDYVRRNLPDMYRDLRFDDVKQIDQVFDMVNPITQYLFKNMSGAKYQAFINRIKSEIGKVL